MRLLLVEDEIKLANALAHILKKNGYVLDQALDGEMGSEMAVTGNYDLVILDRMLPGRDGISILREIRSLGLETPVLFMTAKDAPQDRVEGLDAGADDYLVKPFSTEELLARLRALTRRKNREWVGSATVSASGLTLDPLKCEVQKGHRLIQLSVKETSLLELLMRNRGRVVTKDTIFERVWGYESETELANIDLYIHYLRKKLGASYIKTVRGIGYYIQEEVHVS
ncbi:MAG TPA: response regulator transcription factor [Bacillota bacterium]|nr:response regulator transcription factor [Bacillota bacterium]